MILSANSYADVSWVDVGFMVPAVGVNDNDVSSADSDIKAIADMFTFRGWGQGPRLGARELGLPGRQTNTVNLIEREESL